VDHYRLDDSAILVGPSGHKGYHIEVIYGPIEPAEHVRQALRRFCRDVAGTVGLRAFDAGVYDGARFWRCWNSSHEQTGRYKRRLALDELLHLDAARHVELAAEPREFTPPDPVSSDSLDRDWAQAMAAVRNDHVQRRREPSDGPAPGL